MGTPAENKEIVQMSLDARKEMRKEAEQEVATMQMIGIINEHAAKAEIQKQKTLSEHKKRKLIANKIAKLKKHRNVVLNRLYLSVALIAWFGIFYAIGLTKLWSLIVCVILSVAYLVYNAYVLVQNAEKIAKLT